MKILVMNGPNLDMLGVREKELYGELTLDKLNARLLLHASELGASVEFFQSNYEGGLIDKLHETDADGIVLNAGAYTHYSFALRDAIKCREIPVVEVHMTNVAAREEFRRVSVIAPVCAGSIAGLGADVYFLAMTYLAGKAK